jgi:hypothetical protein
MIQYPWVGGGLGWFYYLYHKNINKTLILQKFCDDFCEELQLGDKVGGNGWSHSKLSAKFFALFSFCQSCQLSVIRLQSCKLSSSYRSGFSS